MMKGLEKGQLSIDDYLTYLSTGLMRDINLYNFFTNCKFEEAVIFVKNRKDMLETEYKTFKEHAGN